MANTSSHPITVNGTRLDTWAYNIKVKNGIVSVPSLRGDNLMVPGNHGQSWTPNKRSDPGSILLSMWVSDKTVDDVSVGTDPYLNWRTNLDTLLRLFNSRYALLDVRHTIGSGVIRQAMCEVKAISDPEMRGDTYGELKVSLDIPGSFWQDVTALDFNFGPTAATIATHNLTVFQDATAPMEELQFVVDGQVINPRLTDLTTGHYVQYNGTVAAGQQWAVDTTTWSTKTGAGIEFTQNGTSQTASTVAVGAFLPRLFGLAPGSPPRVQLTGTSATSGARLRIRAKRKFL